MIILLLLLAVAIGFVLLMLKQANENHVLRHDMQVYGERETLTLFFISDTHTRQVNQQMLQSITEPIDAVIIGGDFADRRTPRTRIEQNLRLLQQLGPIYFVWGNNDREVGEAWLRECFSRYDVTIIENDALILPNSKNRIWLSAIDDTSANYNIELAIEQCKDEKVIFISHNPYIFYKVRENIRPILMMGGHLHGGQIRFGSYGIHPHGSFSKRQGIQTLISNGYGTTLVPFRLGAKPQCHIISIQLDKETTY